MYVRQTLIFTVANVFDVVFCNFFRFLGKTPSENETALAIGGRLATMLLHALCVFLCNPLFEPK